MTYLVDNEGITSFKLFMAYPGVLYSDDGQILRAMQTANESGAMIMMHAENGIAIDVLVGQALARGETDPKYHSLTRPAELEGEATHRAIQLAKVAGNVPLYIVHMSASEALEEVAAARHAGRNVFAETCPQYLYLSLEDQLAQPGFEGAKWVCSTPLRTKHEHHQADLWKGLRMNELAVVSTDHCPFCMKDQKEMGIGDFSKIPNGIGCVEHRMELLYQGVVNGEITLERWVETCCTTPARMFGMYPQKGIIAPGADADVLVWDPNGHTSIGVRQEAPHEHGPLGVGGLRDRRQGRHRPQPWPRRSSRTTRSRAPRATASTSSAASRSIWSEESNAMNRDLALDRRGDRRGDVRAVRRGLQPGDGGAGGRASTSPASPRSTPPSPRPRRRSRRGGPPASAGGPRSCSTCASWSTPTARRSPRCSPPSTARCCPTRSARSPGASRTSSSPAASRTC